MLLNQQNQDDFIKSFIKKKWLEFFLFFAGTYISMKT